MLTHPRSSVNHKKYAITRVTLHRKLRVKFIYDTYFT